MTGYGRYLSKENRDAAAKKLKAQGYNVIRSSVRGAQLHPMYITDWPVKLTEAEMGLGNTLYQTVHKVLYKIEWQIPMSGICRTGNCGVCS